MSDSQRILDGYSEWLNKLLFTNKGEDDTIMWLGDNRWLVGSNLDPGEVFIVSIKKLALNAA